MTIRSRIRKKELGRLVISLLLTILAVIFLSLIGIILTSLYALINLWIIVLILAFLTLWAGFYRYIR